MFASPEVEARMRKTTRQTKKTDEEAIGRTRAEDVPIDVLDTHTIKNLGAFARHDIEAGTFIGEYAGEVLFLSNVRKRKSEYLFNLGSGLTIDASRKGNACRFMNHSSDEHGCNVAARIVNHRGTRRVVFHARRLIRKGEEMMYDYGEEFAKNIGALFFAPCARCRALLKMDPLCCRQEADLTRAAAVKSHLEFFALDFSFFT